MLDLKEMMFSSDLFDDMLKLQTCSALHTGKMGENLGVLGE